MRVYNLQENPDLPRGLTRTLAALRTRRGFDAKTYIAAKAALLNDYMRKSCLSACVLGLSGGVDSALVLALAVTAARTADSPIKRIVPLLMPVFSAGATNQDKATARGREAAARFGLEAAEAGLTIGCKAVKSAVDAATGLSGGDWAEGQLVSYIRTPALYYAASLLAQEGLPALVLGTTNRDEGSYLGFIGKASDAMVDVQLIADAHKSEVYSAAAALGVPLSILQATPTGDMFDGRVDTDVFGAPYDFVELFLSLKTLPPGEQDTIQASWTAGEKAQFEKLSANLEKLHRYNAHKYRVGSPAVHLDVYPSRVPGGWQYGPDDKTVPEKVDTKPFVAPFDMPAGLLKKITDNPDAAPQATLHSLPDTAASPVLDIAGLLRPQEAALLIGDLAGRAWLPAGLNGMRKDFDPARDRTGSWRASSYCPALAALLWRRLQGLVPALEHIPADASADAAGAVVWRAVGVNPLFRFIRYEDEGAMVAHYDSPYDYGDGRRTLKSLIVYLSHSAGTGEPGVFDAPHGDTRFLRDPDEKTPPLSRAYADWDRPARDDEVLLRIRPQVGAAVIFNHRLLHDSAPLPKNTPVKIVLRSDIVYDMIALP